MKIEKLKETYIEQLAYLVDEYREFCGFDKSYNKTKEFFKMLLVNDESTTLIAINSKNEVMGFVNLYPSYSTLALEKIWILNDLGVSTHFRRLGVARALINEAINFAKSSGAIRIELKTEKRNENAQTFYTELGFQTDKENVYYRVPIK